MDLSVVIPVVDDLRLKNCVESIDASVEVIVVVERPTKEIIDLVKSLGIRCFESHKFSNIGSAWNLGIKHATNDKVFLMNSDCTFGRNCLELINDCLNDFQVVKARLTFTHDGFVSKIIAKSREYHCGYIPGEEVPLYTPSLAIRKDLVNVLGYYFDEDIHWTEDSDLRHRIKAAGVKAKYLPDAKIYHAPLGIRKDLMSAFRYGIGERIRAEKGTTIGGHNFLPVLKKILAGNWIRYLKRVMAKKGSLVALYMIPWNFWYFFGYHAQSILNIYNVPPNIRRIRGFFY